MRVLFVDEFSASQQPKGYQGDRGVYGFMMNSKRSSSRKFTSL